jgi:hypothetical protein
MTSRLPTEANSLRILMKINAGPFQALFDATFTAPQALLLEKN